MPETPVPAPTSDDETKRLEHVLAEIAIREAHEDGRQRTADTKLTSALAVLPLIVTLSTTAFFTMLPYALRLDCLGKLLIFVFLCAIWCFMWSAYTAISGLWPARGTYSVVGLRTIENFVDEHTYADMLRTMIREHADTVRKDVDVNGKKLGLYAEAAAWMLRGLFALALIVLVFALVAFVESSILLNVTPPPIPVPYVTSTPASH